MPNVQAAVLERSRRSTAGKRMQSLVGKAQEDDDAFWSHSIWSEGGGGFSSGRKRPRDDEGDRSASSSESGSDDGSSESISDGEGSFRMSDEESEAAVDQFDSDFDESESEEEEEEGGEGATERELIAEEKRNKASQKKKRQQVAFQGKGGTGGRDLIKKKKGAMTKRGPTGEGWNAGLVLNWPASASSSSGQLGQPVTKPLTAPVEVASGNSSSPAEQSALKPQHTAVTQPTQLVPKAIQQTFPIATKTKSKTAVPPRLNLRGGTATSKPKPAASAKVTQQHRPAVIDRKSTTHKLQFTQEDLIIEAIKSTEMENSKWLSARKRVKAEAAQLENAAKAKTINHNPVSRFHSRRGCNNTLTFMDMDHLPDILTRSHPPRKTSAADSSTIRSPRKRRADSVASHGSSSSPDIEKEQTKCVITGKVARYRDPKTMLGYYDVDAFKELRRRFDAGELPQKDEKKKKISTKQSTKRKAPSSGDGSTMIAKLSSTGAKMKVKVKVGNVLVPPPAEKMKGEGEGSKGEGSTQDKPRWDDASDNMYAKPFASLKRRRSPSTLQNGDSSQQELDEPKSFSNVSGGIDVSSQSIEVVQQNGNHAVSNDVSTLQPTTSSNVLALPLTAASSAAVTENPASGTSSAVTSSNGESSNPKKSNVELKPSSAELNTFMQTWISRPENKDSLMPSLQQKQQIIEELGVDKKRLEGWFYRARKKLKQENPPDKTSSVDTKTTPQMTVSSEVGDNSEMKAGDDVEKPAENEVDKLAENEVELSQTHQNNASESKSIPIAQSSVQSKETNSHAKSMSADGDDKNDTQIPLLPSNGNKKCEQTPSKQIQDMISNQSEIQT